MDRDDLYIDDEPQERMGSNDYDPSEDGYALQDDWPRGADLDVLDHRTDDLEGYGHARDSRPPARDFDL
jgi:hypothetical protein